MTTLRLTKMNQLLMERPVNRQTALVVSGGVEVDNTVDATDEQPTYFEDRVDVPAGLAADALELSRMDLRRQIRQLERLLAQDIEQLERVKANKLRRQLMGQLDASNEDSHTRLAPFIVDVAAALLPDDTWQRILTAARLKYLEARAKPRASNVRHPRGQPKPRRWTS